jgi:hypothetical protein
MRLAGTILTVLVLCHASCARTAWASMHEGAAGNRAIRISRIERDQSMAPEATRDPVLQALDDGQAPLLEAMPQQSPILEQLVTTTQQVNARGSLATASSTASDLQLTPWIDGPSETEWPYSAMSLALVGALLGVIAIRRPLFAAVNRAMLWLVVAVRHRGAVIQSGRRTRRRRRSSSRGRTASVSWYFRSTGQSRRTRGSRRWSSSGYRQREYVVADVVYASAPVQPAPALLLLSNSAN